MMLKKYYKRISIVFMLLMLLISTFAQADMPPSPHAVIVTETDQLLYFLITGFSLGIIVYHLILFWCTRETIYVHFSVALLFYTLSNSIRLWNWAWFLTSWSLASVSIVTNILTLILFASFIKKFLILFVDFKHIHPLITQAIDTYIYSGTALIVIYLFFPHPYWIIVGDVLVVVSCLTVSLTIRSWYPTTKHLRSFNITLLLFTLFNAYRASVRLMIIDNLGNLVDFLDFISGPLLFLSFSLTITNRINRDREQRDIAQQNALHQLEKYQTLYQNALEGLFTLHYDGRLLAANPALNRLLNLPDIKQEPYLYAYFNEPQSVWNKIMHQIAQHESIEAFEIQGKNNKWYSLSARRITTNNQTHLEGSLIDISQRKQQSLHLAYLANHDPLTNLYNRSEFENYLQDAISSESTHTLLFIDLDQFKVINDTCGHAAGDECLRQIAEIFKQHARPQDMLARLGGDEFGLVLWDQHFDSGKASAERLRLALGANYFQWLQRIFKTSVSIGVTTLDRRISCGAQALSLADAACYEAKDAGRNRVVINNPDKHATIYRSSQMDMVATLTQALRDNQLVLVQQPIIALLAAPTELLHYEILVRLRTDNGLLNPGAFLPAAQRYNMLPQIDRWVFNRTCAWLAEDDNLTRTGIANINISPETLTEPTFLDFVHRCLANHAIVGEKICFEITEYSALNNFTRVLHHINKLRDIGFTFALDDFGSGFASFDHVKRLPVDFIKIDGQFIRGINQDSTDRTMVRAITDIAHTLGKKVIAEWVEDDDTVNFLRQCGVDFAQGYHLGKPLALYDPKTEIETVKLAMPHTA